MLLHCGSFVYDLSLSQQAQQLDKEVSALKVKIESVMDIEILCVESRLDVLRFVFVVGSDVCMFVCPLTHDISL